MHQFLILVSFVHIAFFCVDLRECLRSVLIWCINDCERIECSSCAQNSNYCQIMVTVFTGLSCSKAFGLPLQLSSAISTIYHHDTFVCMVYHMYHMTCHHIIFVLDISVTFLHHDIFVTSALGPSSSHNVASPPQFFLSVVRF